MATFKVRRGPRADRPQHRADSRFADALMLTRGVLRRRSRPRYGGGIVIRASGGPSILCDLSNERVAVDMEDAVRMNVTVAVQVFVGGEHESQSIENLTYLSMRVIATAYRCSVSPQLGKN